MKNVLTVINEDSGQEARIQAALDLTRALDGHLICLEVEPLPVVPGDYTGEATALLVKEEHAASHRNWARIVARLDIEDISWNRRVAVGDVARCATDAAELADIIVLNRKLEGSVDADAGEIAASTAIRSGKPVVAVPERTRWFDVGGPALIAWDGSPAASAALLGALPLLQLAGSVHLFTAGDGRTGTAPEEAAVYLSRHDIHPEIRSHAQVVEPIDKLIRQECESIGAAYCVMGTYGHSRLKERLFGGVTQRMLSESTIPLVLGR